MCDTINKLGLVSFIKNEIDFIESFIKYHIDIFDSIYFIDDGSTDGTLEIIQKYSSIHLRQVQNSFNLKGEICSEIIHQMTEDIIIPLDADETIVHDNKNIQITNSQYIRQYLQNLPIDGHKYKVNHIYEYNPDHIGWWGIKHHAKIFFPKKYLYRLSGNPALEKMRRLYAELCVHAHIFCQIIHFKIFYSRQNTKFHI